MVFSIAKYIDSNGSLFEFKFSFKNELYFLKLFIWKVTYIIHRTTYKNNFFLLNALSMI